MVSELTAVNGAPLALVAQLNGLRAHLGQKLRDKFTCWTAFAPF